MNSIDICIQLIVSKLLCITYKTYKTLFNNQSNPKYKQMLELQFYFEAQISFALKLLEFMCNNNKGEFL